LVGRVLAYVGWRLLVAFGPTSLPRLQEISIDPAVLAFVVVASLVSSLLLGSLPAFTHAGQARGRGRARASSRAQRARRGAGGARARADRLLRPDAPHVQRAARRRSGCLAA